MVLPDEYGLENGDNETTKKQDLGDGSIGVFWAVWHLPVLIERDLLSIVAFSLLAIGLSFLFTLLFNSSGGSLIPVLLFHATQNWEDGFETVFPSLVGTDWELTSTLVLLLVSVVAVVLVWRKGSRLNCVA